MKCPKCDGELKSGTVIVRGDMEATLQFDAPGWPPHVMQGCSDVWPAHYCDQCGAVVIETTRKRLSSISG
jgi:hypothetical protein